MGEAENIRKSTDMFERNSIASEGQSAMIKRAFDVVVACLGLVLLAPLLLVVSFLIKIESSGPVLFRQERMGRGFRPFRIYKLRTMVQEAPQRGGPITFGADSRITRIGGVLRKTKIDEFPQLLNVLKGEMSLVGPRPEVRKYVEMFHDDYEEILRVLPGITDLASLKYRDEAEILGRALNPEQEYVARVLPEKLQLAQEYVRRSSLLFDVVLILKTVLKILR
jgi:lipopolysaccharide/colanic/teichoic acid biosynthesis glycosyltransferase